MFRALKIVAFGLIAGLAVILSCRVFAKTENRFERLQLEETGNHSWGVIGNFEVFHDKESGVEFVCAFGTDHNVPACFTTGRNWK